MIPLGWYEISLWLFSALAALFAFLSWRWMGLETKEEREKLFMDLMVGSGYGTDRFEYQIGGLKVNEKDGWTYKVKKILLGVFEGNTAIALNFRGGSEFPKGDELEASPYLAKSHPIREKLGIKEIEVYERDRPIPNFLDSDVMGLDIDEFEEMMLESLYSDKRIGIIFDTADPAELENRLPLLNQVLMDVVSEGNYIKERFSEANEN